PRRLQLLRSQVIEEVRLVLGRVPTAKEEPAAGGGVLREPRVMAGRDRVAPDDARPLPERGELQPRVARGARDRGLAGEVRGDERGHDFTAELLLEVDDVVRNLQLPGGAASVRDVVERAAAPGPARLGGMVPELHGQADDLVPLLLEKE